VLVLYRRVAFKIMMMDVNANDYANFICNVTVKRIIRLDGPIMSDYD